MERTIKLEIDEDKVAEVDHKELCQAIGYLSKWNTDGFSICTIYSDGFNDLQAVYGNEGDSLPGYAIGAIWREDRQEYSFHS